MTLEGHNFLQLKKWWDAICYAFFQYLSTNNIWTPYKKLKAEKYNITKFLLQPDTHSKYFTVKGILKHSQEHSE